VGIASAARRLGQYPHQLSGGLRQRMMIAMALMCEPDLLIADEPTTALDVTIQAQILDLLMTLQEQFGMSMLLITHDLGVVAETCDRVAVMYAGEIVEEGPVETIFEQPEHPYTIGLINAIPRADLGTGSPAPIPGSPPDLVSPPPACRFHPRCPYAEAVCREQAPELRNVTIGHAAACHFAGTGRFARIDAETVGQGAPTS
jgi:oligopeptide/dipeptide ABC transporter ATP-binding protein